MYQRMEIIGRLGQDPEAKTTNNGKTVARLSVATSEKWTDRQGQKQEKTEWHRVVVWGEQATHCERFLNKGSLVQIEGKLETRSWEDDKQVTKYTTEVIARRVIFLDRSEGTSNATPEPSFDTTEEIPF